MIFVSKGYFKSKNCLREVKGTIGQRKPLTLMHDPVRGGAPLKTIQDDECPPEYLTDIFKDVGKDRNVIIFHRIKDFQVVRVDPPACSYAPTHIAHAHAHACACTRRLA